MKKSSNNKYVLVQYVVVVDLHENSTIDSVLDEADDIMTSTYIVPTIKTKKEKEIETNKQLKKYIKEK